MSTLKVNSIKDVDGDSLFPTAIIAHQNTSNTDAGTFTSGAWRTRDLNAEISDPDGIVTLSSNQFTIIAGDFIIEAFAPAIQVNGHQIRLYDITNDALVLNGHASFAGAISSGSESISHVKARVTNTSNRTFEIQHRCNLTSGGTWGFGAAQSGGVSWNSGGNPNGVLYTIVKITKVI